MSMITKKTFYELYNKNSPRNPNRHIGPIDARLFLRDLSLPIAYAFAKYRASAHTVTALLLILSLLGNFIAVIPSFWSLVAMVILLEIGQLLDCVDGQLARYYGSASKFGKTLDTLVHIIISVTFFLAVGLRFYVQSNQPLLLLLGGIGAFAITFDHPMLVKGQTIIQNSSFQHLFIHSRFRRYVVYAIQSIISEARFTALSLLILTAIERVVSIPLVVPGFFLLVFVVFAENIIYPLVKIGAQLPKKRDVSEKEWK